MLRSGSILGTYLTRKLHLIVVYIGVMVCQKPAIPGKHNQYKAVPLHEGGEWGTRVQNIAPLNEHAQKCVKIF